MNLVIPLRDEQHVRLHSFGKISGITVTEVIREAVEQRRDTLPNDAELVATAEAVLADMEARAATERDALAATTTCMPVRPSHSRC